MTSPTLETLARDGVLGPQWAVGREEIQQYQEDEQRRIARACDRRQAAEKYAHGVARSLKVVIQWGAQPCTDGQTITALDPGSGAESGRNWWRYEAALATIDHEAAHVRHTLTSQRHGSARDVWVQHIQELATRTGHSAETAEIVRGFVEDVRIETLWFRDHPGAAGPLRIACAAVSDKAGYQPPEHVAPLAAMYLRHTGIDFRPDWCPAPVWKHAQTMARKVQARALAGPPGPEGSAALPMLKIVQEILESLPRPAAQPPPPPRPEPEEGDGGEAEGSAQKSAGGAGNAPSGQPQGSEPAEPDDSEDPAQDMDGEADQDSPDEDGEGMQGGEAGDGEPPWTPPDWHPLQAGAWWLAQQPPEKANVARFRSPDAWVSVRPGSVIQGCVARQSHLARSDVASARAVMEESRRAAGSGEITALVSKIRSLDKARWRGDLSSGRPDPRRLAQMAADLTANACRMRAVSHAPKVALACAIDSSGSMGDNRTLQSEGCALALVEAVRRCGGVAALGAFHHVALSAETPPLAAKCVPILSSGGTPLSKALEGAHASILTTRGRDCAVRVVVVLSDGEAEDRQACRQAVKRCRAAGIQVLGVYLTGGRQSEALRQLATNNVRGSPGWAGWGPQYEAQIDAEVARIVAADPFAARRCEAEWSQRQARMLSANLDGAPACAIRGPRDLARAIAPALRALLSAWEGGRS